MQERVTQLHQTKAWPGEIPVWGQYTFGIAGERFFREIKDHARLLGSRCPRCNLTYLPPRTFCERCFERLEEWREIQNRGKVYTYTVTYIDLEGHRLERPEVIALVEMEGAHGGLVHRLGEVRPEEVRIGLPVTAVFKDPAQRVGSIFDIDYFKPLPA